MSIRPVDMQMMVPKSTEVTRTTQTELRQPEVAQQQFAQQLLKEVEHNNQHVIETNRSEGRDVDKDASNKNKQEARRRRREKERKKNGAKRQDSTSMFDLRI